MLELAGYKVNHKRLRRLMQTLPFLSVIDIFTRQLTAHLLQRSIRQHEEKALWQDLLTGIPVEQHGLVRVRSDNGSQFAAKTVRAFFTSEGIHQEFCRAATPEEDGYMSRSTRL